MRLRSRLLLLIALLVSAALAASFWLIFRAVRGQALADLDRSLEAAHGVWVTLSHAQAENLATTATGKAAEPGFVRVLRGTDQATLLDHLKEAKQNNTALDLLAVYDDQGDLRVATESGFKGGPSDVLIAAALEGQVGASYWRPPPGPPTAVLYMAAVSPIYKQGGVVEGVLLLATRLDAGYVEKLARDTNVQVALLPLQGTGYTTSRQLLGDQPSVRKRSYPLADFAGNSLGTLVMGRDLNDALAYMRGVQGQLLWLGVATVGLAFLVSIPLVGRMTNPVLLLEKTQAEMDAVFQANADGLVALNQAGRVVSANPAAAVCLGVPLEGLTGRWLQELLPDGVFEQLVAAAPSDGQLVQRCHWDREGRTYQLTRTFVASRHAEVGSVLVTRELSGGGSPRDPLDLLAALQDRPESPAEWRQFEKNRLNLLWLSGQRSPSAPAHWPSLLQEFELVAEVNSAPGLEQNQLRLLLLNLWPCQNLSLVAEEGGWWLSVRNPQPPGTWEGEVLGSLLEELQGRLFESEDELRVWLPGPC
ncbi:MAG: PAS domain-containing protein [Candidatus Eremiobacteraeota bacterium]|nr:PAS domain-containing protein [Candidatus Eremiobacteraeota bacterium]MCW5869167.1 PAS domain-containing protein [Candidatus Eremiobacteraeota bacterium]